MAKVKTEKKNTSKSDAPKKSTSKKTVSKNDEAIKEKVSKKTKQVENVNDVPKKASTKSATSVKAPKNLKVANKRSQKSDNNNDEEEEEPGKRYFKCIMINDEGVAIATGRYSGKKPKQAASKACTRLYEEQKEAGNLPEKIIFGMHESTRASKKKKKYFYVGRRVELETPEEVEIDKIDPNTNKKMIIKYYYNNDVRKLTNLEECKEYPLLFSYDAKDNEEQIKVIPKKNKIAKKSSKSSAKESVKVAAKKMAKKSIVKKESDIKVKKNTKSESKTKTTSKVVKQKSN